MNQEKSGVVPRHVRCGPFRFLGHINRTFITKRTTDEIVENPTAMLKRWPSESLHYPLMNSPAALRPKQASSHASAPAPPHLEGGLGQPRSSVPSIHPVSILISLLRQAG